MIFDGFILYQELDLLEIRLNELKDAVDRFVICEATKTFAGKQKPLFFEENKERFKEFLPKINHVIVDDMPESKSRWDLEEWQRKAIMRGMTDAAPEDIIILSDVDEIPSRQGVQKANRFPVDAIIFSHDFYVNWFNRKLAHRWTGTVACRRKLLADNNWNLTNLRNISVWTRSNTMHKHVPKIKFAVLNDGWHFSWMGDIEAIIKKIEAYSHAEIDIPENKDPETIKKRLMKSMDITGRSKDSVCFIDLEQTLPKYVLDNKEKFSKYIFEDF